MDVQLLQRIGNALKYNFFKHFPIDDGTVANAVVSSKEKELLDEKEKVIKELMDKLSEREKVIEGLERDAVMLKQENGYLKEINGLLKAKIESVQQTVSKIKFDTAWKKKTKKDSTSRSLNQMPLNNYVQAKS